MIEANDLVLRYRDKVVLSHVDVALRANELVAIVGPNGSGKSTLLRALAGLLRPFSGTVRIEGKAVHELTPATRARQIALVLAEESADGDVTVRDAIALGRLAHRPWWHWNESPEEATLVEAAARRVGIDALLERRIETLSSGELQRVWIATALAQQARVVLLDEPTSHLDWAGAYATLDILRELANEGAAVAVVLHDLNLAVATADRVLLVGDGTLIADGPVEIVFQSGLLTRAYGAEIAVKRTTDGATVALPRRQATASAAR